ncbi:ATPase, V1/A1 complex, subunit E [Carpediemonas membranifera]|uniref:ATPase, V1/A1 complex, subunit E n=1 Tax=Carpediemonas membranifera TaxID=201153 RepID=A0A8J6B5C8_9EUKA|nr:ATPase, V1/A1 complex, subunit E [Carpediemonas membranifera]|eukprot:KAG9394624.1 ATPase, V1/A1 complex, subunit E [Carpediemonas membranifera]
MNTKQVEAQIAKMIKFIENEANEVVNEITMSAREHANQEKLRQIEAERKKLAAMYKKKAVTALRDIRIKHSRTMNESRMLELEKRQAVLEDAIFKAHAQLVKVAETGEYTAILKKLLVQGMTAYGPGAYLVRARPGDADKATAAIAGACAEAGEDYTATLSEQPLPPAPPAKAESIDDIDGYCAGGVILTNDTGSVHIDCTFDARLNQIVEDQLDQLRVQLFE